MTKSERAPVHGVVIGHGDLPRALAHAAGSIVGDPAGLAVVSNTGETPAGMEAHVQDEITAHPAGVVVFVDMYGSSCSTAGARACRHRDNVEVVYGVNLPMLIRFLSYRHRLDTRELAELMRTTGCESVRGPELT